MKFLILTLFVTFLSLHSVALDKLKIGVLEYPPYVSFDFKSKNIEGYLIDHAKKVFAGKYDVSFYIIPVERIADSLNSHSIDLYLTFFKSKERNKKFSYSKEPSFIISPQICSLRDRKTIHKTDRIIVPRSKLWKSLVSSVSDKVTTFSYSSDYMGRVIEMLKLGRADFVFLPEVFGREEELHSIVCRPDPMFKDRTKLYLGYLKNSPLRDEIDKIWKTFKKVKTK